MAVIDVILGGLILFGLIRGIMKGLFVELASVAALILGVWGAIHFSHVTASYLESRVEWDERSISIAAFAATFIIIVVFISLAGKALTKIADFAALGLLNRLLGGLFGAFKLALMLSVVLVILSRIERSLPLIDESSTKDSILFEPVRDLVPAILPVIWEVTEQIDSSEEAV